MKTPLPTKLSCLAAVLALCGAAARSGAQPEPGADPRLDKSFAVEVRSAELADVVSRLSAALSLPMDAQPGIAHRRVTIYASRATLRAVQDALAGLYRTRW